MKVTELIYALQLEIEKDGDKDVFMSSDEEGNNFMKLSSVESINGSQVVLTPGEYYDYISGEEEGAEDKLIKIL